MVIEHWKDTVQSILSYQKEGTPALTEKEQVRLQELEELIPVYQNLDAEISTKETTVSSLQRAASDEKTNNMIYTTITVIVTGLALGLIVLFANYLRKRKTYFEINYAGGKIAFNVSLYPKAEIMDFQKQLRRAKDFVSEQLNPEPVKTAEPTAPTISKADELEKYAALLEKGIITQEEFETLKRKALE